MLPAGDRPRAFICRKSGKQRYDKKGAQSALNRRMASRRNQPEHLRIYPCKHCDGWHLTHKP